MTVYCLIEHDALHQRVVRVYSDADQAAAALARARAATDGRHWYRVEESEMEDAA